MKILHKVVVDENGAPRDTTLMKQAPIPEVSREYCKVCDVIEANNGERQGQLNIESSWDT